MVIIKSKTLRFRPDAADGGTEEGLSFPQQLPASDHVAVPQHQQRPVATQEIRPDYT